MKVVKILLLFFCTSFLIFFISLIILLHINNEKLSLNNSFKENNQTYKELKKEYDNINNKIIKFKEENNQKWAEVKIWEKAKNKLEKALS